ncbi:hypothetical protein AB0L05_06320 [Nonomuraea pusilla]|uniref:hypothetical protein n=1 Tax=Nonomuraea pusilla TaxID=46177 RepID=UPI00331E6DDE
MTTGMTGSSDVHPDTENTADTADTADTAGTAEEHEAPFDPEATGIIPRLTFDTPPSDAEPSDTKRSDTEPSDTKRSDAKPSGAEAGRPAKGAPHAGDGDRDADRDADRDTNSGTDGDTDGDAGEAGFDPDTTTAIRLPAPGTLHIGHPPTADETPDAAAPKDAAKGPSQGITKPGKATQATGSAGTAGKNGTAAGAPSEAEVTTDVRGTGTNRTTGSQATGGAATGGAAKRGAAADAAAAGTVEMAVEAPGGQKGPKAPATPPASSGTPNGAQAATASPKTEQAPATHASGAAASPKTGQAQGAAAGRMGRLAALVASAPKWLPVVLVLEGLIMYVLALKVSPGPLRGVDPNEINGLGLISALPATAFAAILIMIVSFFVTVAQSTDRKFLLLFQIAAILFALHGAGALVAQEPRFPTAYIHAGFVEFIGRTGETAISIDARMGWPGFFALFAFVTKAAGITDMTPILNWTPLLSNLLYLLPFVLILRQVVATTRARWYAALLFVLAQWIGQDYFSPQGFTFALYLVFVAILLRWFGRVEARTKPVPPKGLRKLLGRLDAMTPGELANTGTFRADKLLMLLMLLALFFAAVASHQITPFMMLGVLTALLLFKRSSLTWGLPFFLGLVVLAWISYLTVGFWAGQIDAIFGGLGKILTNLQRNTGDRIAGSDPAHALVLKARLGILAMILSLAAVGLFRRLRRGVFDRAALILLCVPVLALGLQSYGGEIGLRIYMFALPGACLLAAYAFFPNLPADSADVREETVPIRRRNVRFNPQLTRKVTVVLAACTAVVFAMAFLVARYGNEKFERVTSGEVAALRYVYAHDKPSAKVLYLVPKEGPEVTPTLPWGERDVERVNFAVQALVHKDPTVIKDAVDKLKEQSRNSYLMVSRGQVSYLQLNEGFPEDWGPRFRAALDASPDLKRVFANEDAALYTWKKFVKGTEIPDPNPYKGRGDPTSPWTPVGIAALAVTWVALFWYEVLSLNGRGRASRARRRLLFLAVPAFVIALAVIAERFIVIAQK